MPRETAKALFGAALLGTLGIPAASGGAEGTDDLRRQLETLQQQLKELEAVKKRVEELEQRLSEREEAATPVSEETSEPSREPPFHVGGALRFNYFWKGGDDETRTKRGDVGFDLFRLNVDGESEDIQLSAEYRFYPYMDTLHHGWIGFRPSSAGQVQVGVTKVPFGLLPYASHSYWFGLPYYLGLADDYDAGAKYVHKDGPWDARVAFFKNDELGDGGDWDRISYDAAVVDGAGNEETNTAAARLAYTFNAGSDCSQEVGLSGQWGELYNVETDATGDRWAAAAHLDNRCGRWNTQLELGRYRHDPAGGDDTSMTLGGFATTHEVAAEGSFAVANVAYNVPVQWPRLKLLTCYNDFSVLDKEPSGFDNSYLNTTGCVAQVGPTYTYLDLIHGRNAVYVGDGSLAGGGSDDWERRLNLNIGYYW